MSGTASWLPPAGLERALKRAFGVRAHLFPTATMTGLHLWRLTRNPDAYPPLPPALAHLIVSTSGQGRIEAFARDAVTKIIVMDARQMYVACCGNLPRGAWAYDEGPFVPHAPARYRVRFTPPADWGHVGLLPVMGESPHAGWLYPTRGTWETWVGWTEIALALARGWDVRVIERIIWDNAPPDPLALWRAKLLRIADAQPEYARAVREIIIRTIGGFHRIGRTVTRTVARVEDVPDDVLDIDRTPDGGFRYTFREMLSEQERKTAHPEWSADIYAKARTRLLHYVHRRSGEPDVVWGALTVPVSDVLGMHTDALYLARDPGWPDVEVPGAMREKARVVLAGPRRVATLAELHAVLEGER